MASSTRRSSNRRAPGPAPSRNPSGTLTRPRSAISAKPPSSPPAPVPARPGSGPDLQAPKTNPDGTGSTWNSTAPTPGLPARRPERAARGGDRAGGPTRAVYRRLGANELFYPNKADRPWRYIVLHHSASATGNYDQIDREHRKILGYDGCGYHFVIGNGTGSGDGQIEVAQRWNNQKQGVHCRNARTHDVDEYGIGICLVGDLDQQPPTPRQIAATQALIAYLSQRYHIDARPRRDPRPPRRHPDRLPGQVLPERGDPRVPKPRAAAGRATWKVVR